jgi:hypothetical protein
MRLAGFESVSCAARPSIAILRIGLAVTSEEHQAVALLGRESDWPWLTGHGEVFEANVLN